MCFINELQLTEQLYYHLDNPDYVPLMLTYAHRIHYYNIVEDQ